MVDATASLDSMAVVSVTSVSHGLRCFHWHVTHSANIVVNKKLSYPQRKCASNVTVLYGADGISV